MKPWKQFEEAVAAFVAALDPKAIVKPNVRLPERHTGLPRQRDVWVEAMVCAIFPVSLLISCKRLRRKINTQDMDAFFGELLSSGAHKGVLYSHRGFTEQAIVKATASGVSCCRLYADQPADLPESLILKFFCCYSSFRIRIESEALPSWGRLTLGEVFDLPVPGGNSTLEALVSAFLQRQQEVIAEAPRAQVFPASWATVVQVQPNHMHAPLNLWLEGKWRIYRAKVEAHYLHGTYSLTERRFTGSQCSPWIDRLASEPGPGWELLETAPAVIEPGTGIAVMSGGDVRNQLESSFRGMQLHELARHQQSAAAPETAADAGHEPS